MRAQLGALALVLLAPNAIAYSVDFQPTSTVPDQAVDMPIVAFTTLTMAESTTQPELYNDNSGSKSLGEQIDDEHAQEPPLPLNLVNERVRKKMDQDLFKFKSIILHLTDTPDIQPESVDSDSPLVPGEQLSGTPTSSAPRVISINVVMPTFAIKITEYPGASDVDTVLTIASFINNAEEPTRVAPIFGAAEVTPEPQRAPNTVARFTKAPIASSRIPDRYPTVSAVQRHEITLDEMELLSILHLQSVVPTEANAAPHAGFYGIPMHTPSVAQGISSPPVFSMASPYPYPPMPQPVSSAVEPSRSWPTPRHRSNNGQRLKSKSSGKPHRSAFIGMSPDAVVSGSTDGSADSPAGDAPPASNPRVIVTQSIYAPSAPSPSVLHLPLPPPPPPSPASSPPARPYYLPSHLSQPEVTSVVIHETQAPGITVLLRPTRLAPLELESQDSSLAEPVVVLPPPPEATANPPTMFVDSPPQQNTPIIPFISNGSRLPIPTPQDPKVQEVKSDMNANGLASLLENVLHIPANAITINGRPISENSNIIAGKKGQGNIVIVGAKGVGGFANKDGDEDDEDDDDMDSDWDNESTTTHMLDVDRARNHRRVGSKTLDLDENSDIRSGKASEDSSDDEDDEDDDDSASDSDDDSDSNSDSDDTVEGPSSTSSTPSSSSPSTLTPSTATKAESTTPLSTKAEPTTPQSTESITSSSSSSLTSSSLESLSSTPSSSTAPSDTPTTSSLVSSSSPSGSSLPSTSTSTSTEVVDSARSLLSLARLLST